MTHRFVTRATFAALALAAAAFASPVRAWDLELQAAIAEVHLGKATERQLALVRRNNNVINAMASSGRLNNAMYQSVQADFARFNAEIATQAAAANKLKLVVQTPKGGAPRYSPGTDSDFITSAAAGNRMTPDQIEGSIRTYNDMMNKRLGTSGVDYAKRLNTDFMANPKQMSAEEFAAVAKLNNDAYKRQASAVLEAEIRAKGGAASVDQLLDYQRDMRDLVAKKHQQVQELQTQLSEALKADPKIVRTETKELIEELTLRQQQQAKYIERFTETTRLTAKHFNVPIPADIPVDLPDGAPAKQSAAASKPSEIAKQAADRSIVPPEGAAAAPAGTTPEALKAAQNKRAAAVSSGLDEHQVIRATGDSVRVETEAVRTIRDQAARLPEREKLLDAIAEQLAGLPPAQQGELMEHITKQLGGADAADVAGRARKLAADARWQRDVGAAKQAAAEVIVKGMWVLTIAGIANDARAWIRGEMSNVEAAEAIADGVGKGLYGTVNTYYKTGQNLAGWKETYDANNSAFVNERQARIYTIAKALHDRGVPLDQVKGIVVDMENGSEASLDRTILDLAAKKIAYAKPPPVERTYFSDRTWMDYFKAEAQLVWEIGHGMVASPVRLAVNTGKDISELVVLVAEPSIGDAELAILDQQNAVNRGKLIRHLVALGADPGEAAAAVEACLEGRADGIDRLHRLRDTLRSPAAAKPEPSPAERAARRAHIVDRLAKLNHGKLQAVFAGLGIAPPEAFMHCLCRSAGYGAAGTAQFYHPGAIGNSPSPACDQAGEPCVVSGFGCLRHPLPGDGRIWEACLAGARLNPTLKPDGTPEPESGVRLDEAIEQALRQRPARAP